MLVESSGRRHLACLHGGANQVLNWPSAPPPHGHARRAYIRRSCGCWPPGCPVVVWRWLVGGRPTFQGHRRSFGRRLCVSVRRHAWERHLRPRLVQLVDVLAVDSAAHLPCCERTGRILLLQEVRFAQCHFLWTRGSWWSTWGIRVFTTSGASSCTSTAPTTSP